MVEMMLETILDSSQDFGMSNGALPQWKRELLQRRAARSRPVAAAPAPPPPPPPPPPTADDIDEELRYGPGIVKRLKSRYLSLALRDAPRRRPSVLRRAASLEHLLDERPPPAPRAPRPARPASMAAPAPLAPTARRDSVKRARSVDALSRLDSCEVMSPPPPPRPPGQRSVRPPRRPAPLLRDAERPPPDVVRSTLRKFESAPTRRPAPAARVSAVLRGLEGSRCSLTPERQEPEARTPSPTDAGSLPPTSPPPPLPADSPPPTTPPPLSPPPALGPSPPISPSSPTNIAPTLVKLPETRAPASSEPQTKPAPAPRTMSPGGQESEGATAATAQAPRLVSRAALEGIARAGSSVRYAFEAAPARAGSHLPPLAATNPVLVARRVGVIRPMPASPRVAASPPPPAPDKREDMEPAALVNGHSTPEPRVLSRIGAAGIERAWSGSPGRRQPAPEPERRAPWPRAVGRPRAPPPAATSVVFNFSNRKEVPDYIENDGIILRATHRNRIKAGESGVVVLRGEAQAPAPARDSDSEPEDAADGPPSPCAVRFLNDNVLINGRSSMPARPLRDPARAAKLKLQFDDSLTRTFEYPSETSLCEDSPPPLPPAAPAPAPDAPHAHLADNTHIVSAALSRYTPSKTPPTAFQLGVTRHAPPPPAAASPPPPPVSSAPEHNHTPEDKYCGREAESGASTERGHAVPCGADAARSWSEARTTATDLLF